MRAAATALANLFDTDELRMIRTSLGMQTTDDDMSDADAETVERILVIAKTAESMSAQNL